MSSSNLGFFQWIRECVRRAVLLGFSDAVEQLGTPTDATPLNAHLAAVLRESPVAALPNPATAVSPRPSKPERKRLGRSLDQLRGATSTPAGGSAPA